MFLILFLLSISLYAQTSIGVTVIAAPVGGSLTLDSYVWNIAFANDGTTIYQNDQQATVTVKSGNKKNFRIDFASQNLGYVTQGSNQVAYYIKATVAGGLGLVGTPAITTGYVQLTGTQSITFNQKTPSTGINFYVGLLVNPIAGEFYIAGNYTDTLTITYTAL